MMRPKVQILAIFDIFQAVNYGTMLFKAIGSGSTEFNFACDVEVKVPIAGVSDFY